MLNFRPDNFKRNSYGTEDIKALAEAQQTYLNYLPQDIEELDVSIKDNSLFAGSIGK